MNMADRESIGAVLDYWFGTLDHAGMPAPGRHRLWFGSDPETDRTCTQRFGVTVAQAIAGDLDHWTWTDDGLVALIVLLDQFTRNIFRGEPRAFSGDERALQAALDCIDTGRDHQLPTIHRVFVYMPLEHSEDLSHQQRCVSLFGQLAAASGNDRVADFYRYAVAHHDVIARFDRFPHRNAILGRRSTAEEIAYLAQHGGF